MNEVILSGLGILLALCGMTVLIFRRWGRWRRCW